jgi:peptidoglycan/LPS O-acetylase OafA/YrhL
MRQFTPLTSLRLFLALWVLCRHWFYVYDSGVQFFNIGFTTPFFDRGYLGVDGFFILSGFILAYNYAPTPGRPLDRKAFLVARIARIYPVYLTCLVVTAIALLARDHFLHSHLAGTQGYTAGAFVREALLINAWRYAGAEGWNDVAWSVSAEWFAYVFFPLFLLAAPVRNRLHMVLLGAAALGALAVVEYTSPEDLALAGGLARLVPEFLIGVLLFRLREATPAYQGHFAGGLMALILCVIGIKTGLDTIFVLGAAVLVFSLAYDKDALHRVMSVRWLAFLGEVSYAIYIVQRIPQHAFGFARGKIHWLGALPGAVQAMLLLAITIGCAVLLHVTVEKPMRRWINQRFGARRARTAPAGEDALPAAPSVQQ